MRARLAAGLAALLTLGVLGVYLRVLRSQTDDPPPWVLVLFLLGIGSALWAAVRSSRTAARVGLGVLGLLTLVSLLSIGPLLVPSVLLLALCCGRDQLSR